MFPFILETSTRVYCPAQTLREALVDERDWLVGRGGGGGGGGEVGGRREREVEDMFFCFKNEQLVHFEA